MYNSIEDLIFLDKIKNLYTYEFQFARERGIESPSNNKYLSLKSMSGSDDGLDRSEMTEISRTLDSRPSGQRSNSSVHVCWHR